MATDGIRRVSTLYLIVRNNCAHIITDAPQNGKDGDFRSEHPYVTAALAVTMIGVGTAVVLPAVTVGILGAIGFGSGGVAAGRHFPHYLKILPRHILTPPRRKHCSWFTIGDIWGCDWRFVFCLPGPRRNGGGTLTLRDVCGVGNGCGWDMVRLRRRRQR